MAEFGGGRAGADEAYLDAITDEDEIIGVLQGQCAPFLAPTLILTGRQDNICGYRDAWEVLELYPRATFAVLDRAGHILRGEQEAPVHRTCQRMARSGRGMD